MRDRRRALAVCLLLAACLAAPAAQAAPPRDDGWWMVAWNQNTVVTDAGEERARRLATQLESVQSLLASLGGWAEPGKPLVVLATRNEDGMRRLLGSRGRGHMPSGLFVPGLLSDNVVIRLDVAESELAHECTHALLSRGAPGLPLWLD